ncbi:hypothetical protein U1Q18_007335 [Sarracenia purpurea var. burkii]
MMSRSSAPAFESDTSDLGLKLQMKGLIGLSIKSPIRSGSGQTARLLQKNNFGQESSNIAVTCTPILWWWIDGGNVEVERRDG